jgi:sugar transferase (PEP-CTERM/EpsH1 system associated)
MVRILIITDCLPYPPFSGDRLRVYNLLRRIAAQHEVWLATLVDPADREEESLARLRGLCQMVATARVERRHPLAHLPGLARYALAGKPLELKFQFSAELASRIREMAIAQNFDIVHIEHSHMASYLEALPPGSKSKRLLVFHNVVSQQYSRLSGFMQHRINQVRYRLHGWMMRRWEPRYAGHFDRCVTVSEEDRQQLLHANPHLHIDVIPNGVDTKGLRPLAGAESPLSLIFVGKMSSPACIDGSLYLCREILPLVRREIPDVEVWLVGADPKPEVQGLDGNGVHVTGRVDDVVSYYGRCGVSVVPIRAGGGTRLKILEAMALGRPVVSTSIGCEGLGVIDGEHLLLADNSREFAEQIVRLLRDDVLGRRLTANARSMVEAHYDWDLIAVQQMQIYTEMAG